MSWTRQILPSGLMHAEVLNMQMCVFVDDHVLELFVCQAQVKAMMFEQEVCDELDKAAAVSWPI